MARSLIDCVGTARTAREKVSLTNWARRGLPALVFIASAMFASPAYAANPDASISITFSIDENCLATATMTWSDQPGGVKPGVNFCEGVDCFGYVSVTPGGTAGVFTRQVQLSPSADSHSWYAVGILYIGGKFKVLASEESAPVTTTCGRE